MRSNSLTPVEMWERKRVGAILRAIRDSKNMTGDELANKVFKSRSFLANVEAGRKQLPPDLVPVISLALGVDPIVFSRSAGSLESSAA
jgi:transcriptional regulator with XRE-family HTH domain